MPRYVYPIELTPDDNETLLVSCPDIPELTTFGETEKDALAHAVGALATMIDTYMRVGRPIPSGSAAKGRPTVVLPALMAMKVSLYMALRESGLSKSELARMLKLDVRQVRRMLDPLVSTRVEELERALAALGKRIEIRLQDAA